MRYVSLREVVDLHRALIAESGHSSLNAKAAALGFSLALNHPFVDGNKRVAHATMEVFLAHNGLEIVGDVDEQERLMLDLAAGSLSREALERWLDAHTVRR
jgi:death-on-curing protein